MDVDKFKCFRCKKVQSRKGVGFWHNLESGTIWCMPCFIKSDEYVPVSDLGKWIRKNGYQEIAGQLSKDGLSIDDLRSGFYPIWKGL